MEEVNASCSVGEVSLYTSVDPLGSVTRNNFDLFPFFRRQFLAEEPEDFKSMVFVHPNNPVFVHVVNNGDIGKAFAVTCFIDTDATKTLQTRLDIRLYSSLSRLNAVANRAPVDTFEKSDGRLGQHAA
jgi:hypothetical protein